MTSLNESSENTNINSNISETDSFPKNEKIKNINILKNEKRPKRLFIDPINQRYPYCIVWTPIPCISWFIPNIGHAGICDSEGIIYDFAGPYFVSVDNMAFGNPTKFVILELNQKEFEEYDKAVEYGRKCYKKLNYDFFCNNCHSFIARVLNKLNYKGRNNYTMIDVWWILTSKSKYISWMSFLKTYSGFIIIIILFYILFYTFKHL